MLGYYTTCAAKGPRQEEVSITTTERQTVSHINAQPTLLSPRCNNPSPTNKQTDPHEHYSSPDTVLPQNPVSCELHTHARAHTHTSMHTQPSSPPGETIQAQQTNRQTHMNTILHPTLFSHQSPFPVKSTRTRTHTHTHTHTHQCTTHPPLPQVKQSKPSKQTDRPTWTLFFTRHCSPTKPRLLWNPHARAHTVTTDKNLFLLTVARQISFAHDWFFQGTLSLTFDTNLSQELTCHTQHETDIAVDHTNVRMEAGGARVCKKHREYFNKRAETRRGCKACGIHLCLECHVKFHGW